MALDEFMHFFTEEKISTKERNKLDESQFGIPELRKYPLTDEKHVLQAVRFFNKAEEKYKPELARRIVKRAKELNMTWTQWFNHDGCMHKYRKDLSKEDQKYYALHAHENDNAEKKSRHDAQKERDKRYEERRKIEKEWEKKGWKSTLTGGWYKESSQKLDYTPEAYECWNTLFTAKVKYDKSTPNTWKLKSPESVIRNKKGNCHDISYYVYKNLDKFAKKKVDKHILFMMEYKEGSDKGGATHSICYQNVENGICSVEYSWEKLSGVYTFFSLKELINFIKREWDFSKGFDKLFFAEIKNVDKLHPGMTLDQYVKIATSNKEIISEAFAYDAITGERVDLGPSTMTEEELRSRMVHGNGDDFTSGTSLTRDNDYNEPDDCYCEADVNGLVNANMIASKIHEKYESDKKEPIGNQNCQLCTWCAEAQFRGKDVLPRPIYSPRDPALEIKGEDIVINPERISIKSGLDDLLFRITETPYSRWYCHVKWKDGNGGHEFLLLNIDGKPYLMDPQQGLVDKLIETHSYIKDTDWSESYICRLDDKEFNKELFNKYNDPSKIVPWDAKLDIPFMVKEGLLSPEEAEEYFKKYPDEAPKDRHFLSYEELDRLNESKNIFTSGDFDKYGKDVDLTDARGPIQESVVMEFDHKSEKIPVNNVNFDKVYFGSPKNYSNGIKIDRPLFVTPFKGIASIFIYGDLDIQNKVPRGSYNLQYEEWNTASDEEMSKPFKEVHVYVEGYPELEPYEIENTGYIHTVDASKYKDDFYRYEWMSDSIEYLIDNDSSFVDVEEIQEVTVHYYVSGKPSANPKLGPYKKPIQESAWNDIKNGVNPYSKNLVFHISKDGALDGQIFKPRVPEYITKYDPKDPKFEDNTTGRICFSPSIEGCLNAILVNIGRWKTADKLGDWYVYIPEKPLNEYKHTTNKDIVKGKKVYDANLTKEIWIEEPVRLKQYGVIHVDQVKASDKKHTVPTSDNVKGDRRYYSFKWHWLVKPKVLKDVKYDYSKHETTENLEDELWRFKYGLIKDGKLVKNTSKEDWYKYWRLADPEEFEQAKGGNCYDYVEWEAGYLDAFGYKCNKYFILTSNGNTHAFIVVPDDGKFYFVDGAFNKIDGKTNIMKEFNSLQDCFEYITDAIKKYEKNESLTFTIYDYTNEDMKPGTPMKEFEEWITSHGKKVNMSKSIKEEYNMSDFERDPSVFRMFMEADENDSDDKDADKQEDTKESSNNKNDTDEEGDAIVSVSTTEITTTTDEDDDIGTDDGSGEQNQYDPKEVEYLNKLIASEADAISEYFEYGKLTRVPVLSKLYTDIGDEERFHLEQLIYAKSYLTGDKYEPKDSKVRREYEELLELGMDEETAMTTAIDKTRLIPEDDITEEEIEEFAILSQMSEMMSFQNEIIMECMDDTSDIRKALSNANTEAFMESVFIMEDVSNLNTKQGQKELGSKNPIRVIIGMFRSIYRIIINLVKKAKLAFQKKRLKNKKKWAWIKKHGIKGLFQSGVSLYFWNDQTNKYEIADALKYLQMVWDTCNLIIKNAGITDIPEEKFSIQKIIQTLGADIKFKPMYVKNLDSAIKDLQGTMLSKSKLIVNDNNQEELEKLFFGYTDSGYETMEREGENSKSIDLSKNIYNQMNIVLDAFSKSSAYVGELLNRLEIMEGKSDTIYQKNNKLYNKCVQTAGELTKALNKFNAAVSHDISTVTKIDNGLMEAVNKADEGDKADLDKLNDDRAKAKAEALQNAANEKNEETKTVSRFDISNSQKK